MEGGVEGHITRKRGKEKTESYSASACMMRINNVLDDCNHDCFSCSSLMVA